MTLSAKPLTEVRRALPLRRPLASKGGVRAKRALSSAIRLPVRLTLPASRLSDTRPEDSWRWSQPSATSRPE